MGKAVVVSKGDARPVFPEAIFQPPTTLIIGLTGNIGCGKSTAGRLLAARGLERIDCDEVVRGLLIGDANVQAEVFAAFGDEVADPQEGINRKRLGAIVFADRRQLDRLEAILHPRVSSHWQGAIHRQPDLDWVVEVPLLFEKKLQNWFDLTICLACDRATQLERLTQRGMEPGEAAQRMAAQLPLNRKIELADCVLLNNGTLAFLSDQIDWLIQTKINT